MDEMWVCAAGDERLVVRCVGVLTAWEVRQFAAKKLGADPSLLDCRSTLGGAPFGDPVVEVRWAGDDYAHGGTPGGRRMQERPLGAADWTDA
jgi:hypothetical protein